MSENQQNKIKVVDIFHGKPVSENSEKSEILDKFGFEKGIILNAISPNYVKTNVKGEVEKNNEKEKDKRNSILFREQCEYCLTRFSISGHLILTKESLLFEPDLRDQNVIIHGYGAYQIFIDLCDIYECAHIVVPTRGTYLRINDDPCGFVQVLLKNKYQKETNETNVKKNNQENETNKNKGGSYYKYISKSLSFVYNLAHPLVQSTSSKEETNKESEHGPTESDSLKNSKETYMDSQRTTRSLELNKTNKSDILEIAGKKENGINNSDSSDTKSNILKFSINGSENSNNGLLSSVSDNKNGEFPRSSNLDRPRKCSLLNFDADAKNNVVKHLQDNDLKIYQRINQTHYSNVARTLPVITYKNNLNTLNSKSISKESSFSELDVNTVEEEEEE